MKSLLSLVLVVLGLAHLSAQAQETPEKPVIAKGAVSGIWVFTMAGEPPNKYAVRLDSIQTVTYQDYDLRRDGEVRRVYETTVETSGGNRAKFYFEDTPIPATPFPTELNQKKKEVENAVKKLANISTSDEARVTKDYPATTHSVWTEFKLQSKDEVTRVHNQLMHVWAGQKESN